MAPPAPTKFHGPARTVAKLICPALAGFATIRRPELLAGEGHIPARLRRNSFIGRTGGCPEALRINAHPRSIFKMTVTRIHTGAAMT
jgi:hypothetical protein